MNSSVLKHLLEALLGCELTDESLSLEVEKLLEGDLAPSDPVTFSSDQGLVFISEGACLVDDVSV